MFCVKQASRHAVQAAKSDWYGIALQKLRQPRKFCSASLRLALRLAAAGSRAMSNRPKTGIPCCFSNFIVI